MVSFRRHDNRRRAKTEAAIPTGARGAMTIMYQYDVIQDPRSPYGTGAFLSIGFNF